MEAQQLRLSKYIRFTPDDYSHEPELWLAGQAGHIFLGLWLAMVASGAWLYITGDFPRRVGVFVLIALAYMAYELFRQGWRGSDTLQDWAFVSLYGSGGSLYCFREFDVGSGQITADLNDLLAVAVAPTVHLMVGTAERAVRRARKERDNKNV